MRSFQHALQRTGLLFAFLILFFSPCYAQLPVFEDAAERDAFIEARRSELRLRGVSLKGPKRAAESQTAVDSAAGFRRDDLGRALKPLRRVRAIPDEVRPADPGIRYEGETPDFGPTPPLPGPFIVNSAWDSADQSPGDGTCFTGFILPNATFECTFRAAIEEANSVVGTDTVKILFELIAPPEGDHHGYDVANDLWTITPNIVRQVAHGRLPAITRPNVHIDGETQPGVAPRPDAQCGSLIAGVQHQLKVFVDGSLVTTSTVNEGLIQFDVGADGGHVRGLAVGNAEDRGVFVKADQVLVECLYVGTYWDGETRAENFIAVDLSGSHDVSVRNSLVSGSSSVGLELAATATGSIIESNLIGTTADGAHPLGNSRGIEAIVASGARIGGANPLSWNLISGNTGHGVVVGIPSSGTIIEGNRIGTTLDGSTALANGFNGIQDYGTETRIGGLAASAGNVISGNTSHGVGLYGTLPVVEGNLIGTNPAGDVGIGNGGDGVHVATDNARIGGADPAARNLISGNADDGVQLADTANVVQGNFIGTDITGNSAVPNGNGVYVTEGDNDIGGLAPGEGNLISGNMSYGLAVELPSYTVDINGPRILGNRIGTNAAGTAAVPNQNHGVADANHNSQWLRQTVVGGNLISGNQGHGIWSGNYNTAIEGNVIGLDITGSLALPNAKAGVYVNGAGIRIGGETLDARNFIAGNAGSTYFADVYIDTGAGVTVVQGNYIGSDLTGMTRVSNLFSIADYGTNTVIGGDMPEAGNLIANGIWTFGTNCVIRKNLIGTTAHGNASIGTGGSGVTDQAVNTLVYENVISGNWNDGVLLNNPSRDCTIWSNFIGTDADGVGAVPNLGYGIEDQGIGTRIGDTNSDYGNKIAFNALDGVFMHTNPTTTPVLSNEIYANGGLGINIESAGEGPFGETYNDPGDTDGGPNQTQNYPVLPSLSSNGVTTNVQFSLNSTPNDTFRVELFRNTVADESGFGEGQQLAWALDVVTDASGNATLPPTPISALLLPIGSMVTATATRIKGAPSHEVLYTSEFSNAVLVDGLKITFQGSVYLEGPYQGGGLMATGGQFKAALPLLQPYHDPDYDGTLLDYDGIQFVSGHPPEIIDWIVLSLRNSYFPIGEVARRVALLRYDGQIVDLDGAIQVPFYGIPDGLYYVVVCHRNHVCAMSEIPVAMTPVGSFDFTAGNAFTAGPPPLRQLGDGEHGLFAADANADGRVQALDFNHFIEANRAGHNGYLNADFDMDGVVFWTDFNQYKANTVAGAASQVP